jgi:acyl carrier protein
MDIEKEFSISIPDDIAVKLTTVGKAINYIERLYANRVKAIIINRLGVEEVELTNDAHFMNDLGADSLDCVELVMDLEKEFSILIPDDIAVKLTTVGKAINYIKKHVK